MIPNPRLEVKQHFDLLYDIDTNVAKHHTALYLESLELENLNLEDKILKIYNEYNLIQRDVQSFARKDYLNFADCRFHLFNVFFSRYILFDAKEEIQLLESLILNEKHNFIIQLFEDTKAKFPLFDFLNFLKGVRDIVFYELEQKPTSTSRGDYYRMIIWQIQKKVECVVMEFKQFRQRFIQNVNGHSSLIDCVKTELEQLEVLFKNSKSLTPEQLYTQIGLLTRLSADCLPEDRIEFHKSFCHFFQGKKFPYALNPQILNQSFENIVAGKLSNIPICCWSLIKYRNWLIALLKGNNDLTDQLDCNYNLLFIQTYEKGLARNKKYIADFHLKYPLKTGNEEKYKGALWTEANKLRTELKKLKNTDYYQSMINRELVESYFIDHCILETDLNQQVHELVRSVELHEMIRFIKNELYQIDKELINPLIDIPLIRNHFAEIFSVMAPNQYINNQIRSYFFKTSLDISIRRPFFMVVEDFKDFIDAIFSSALYNLQLMLVYQPGNLVAIYSLSQLRILKSHSIEVQNNWCKSKEFLKILKKTFKTQVEIVQGLQKIDFEPIKKSFIESKMTDCHPIPLQKPNKPLAFNYNKIRDDKLNAVLKALIKLGAISPLTTLPQFRKLFNGQEVTEPIEWLADQGDLMTFIKEMVRINEPEFTTYKMHWRIAIKCFVKEGGMQFDANKLRLSKPTSKESEYMDAARKFR